MTNQRRQLSWAAMGLTHLFLLVSFTNASSYDDTLGLKLESIVTSSASTASTAALPNQAPLALPTSPWHPKQATSDPTTTTTEPETNNNLQQQSNIPSDNNNNNNMQNQHHHHYHHHPLAPLRRRRRRSPLWTIPFVASAASFVSFRRTSRLFHGLVQWMSDNTWVPKTFKELNLQANVVTQVINGPVITSISVLFASLVSMTISSLYQRQADIRLCLTNEIQALRILHTILQPPTVLSSSSSSHAYASASPTTMTPEEKHLAQAQDYLHQYIQYFADEINSRGMKRPSVSFPSNGNTNTDNPHHHNDHKNEDDEEEADHPPPPLLALLAWCQQEPVFPAATGAASSSLLYANVSDWVCRLWSDRSHRHLAWSSTFPMVHYITLTFLAVGIGIAFLVATDQSTSIFLDGLPVRILWSILMGSFTALAVICYDLSSPFGGAYQVTTATTTMPWI